MRFPKGTHIRVVLDEGDPVLHLSERYPIGPDITISAIMGGLYGNCIGPFNINLRLCEGDCRRILDAVIGPIFPARKEG